MAIRYFGVARPGDRVSDGAGAQAIPTEVENETKARISRGIVM
jgi:hypothetical protein